MPVIRIARAICVANAVQRKLNSLHSLNERRSPSYQASRSTFLATRRSAGTWTPTQRGRFLKHPQIRRVGCYFPWPVLAACSAPLKCWGFVGQTSTGSVAASRFVGRGPNGRARVIVSSRCFTELQAELTDLSESVQPGIEVPATDYVIKRYHHTEQNLRTQLHRIADLAVVEAWPKPFMCLRASRRTELERSGRCCQSRTGRLVWS